MGKTVSQTKSKQELARLDALLAELARADQDLAPAGIRPYLMEATQPHGRPAIARRGARMAQDGQEDAQLG